MNNGENILPLHTNTWWKSPKHVPDTTKQGQEQGNMPTLYDISEKHEGTQGRMTFRQTQHIENHVATFAQVKITQW